MKLLSVLLCAACVALGPGCTADERKPKPGQAAIGACKLDTAHPGLMRRAGRVSVRMKGAPGEGVTIDMHDVPCLCGPMFNEDVPRMGIVAGQGIYFEACLPHGSIVLSAHERVAGQQVLHGYSEHGGAELSFTRTADSVYSTRGLPSDRIAFSADFWKATAEVELHDVASDRKIQADVRFDCSQP